MAQQLTRLRSSKERCGVPDLQPSAKIRPERIPRGKVIERTRELMELTIDFIEHPLFELADGIKQVQALRPVSLNATAETTRTGPGLAFVSGLVQTPLLTPEEERFWFTWMNFLKSRAERNRRLLDLSRLKTSLLEHIDADLNEAIRVRNHIVESNLRLVVSLARKFSNSLEQMSDLISEGSAPLIRSVELFDISLGNRFSTYCTWAVRNQMLRYLKRIRSLPPGSSNEGDSHLENLPDERTSEEVDASANQIRVNVLNRLLASLSEREKSVIKARFGLDGHARGQTLAQISTQIGLSKERTRQIVSTSLSKLRSEIRVEDLARLGLSEESDVLKINTETPTSRI